MEVVLNALELKAKSLFNCIHTLPSFLTSFQLPAPILLLIPLEELYLHCLLILVAPPKVNKDWELGTWWE